ncbi:MAG: hypothetical protein KF746_17460 [Chitinophagaceae bacterium]|nr:hypothetical protein [Chitinophagaceae bacterium]
MHNLNHLHYRLSPSGVGRKMCCTWLFLCILQFIVSQPSTPVFKSFQPVTTDKSMPPVNNFPSQRPPNYNPLQPNDPYREQNLKLMRQGGMTILGAPGVNQQKQLEEIRREIQMADEDAYMRYSSGRYQQQFSRFLQMNPDDFSISKAIYLSESAWYDNPPSWQQFQASIQKYANVVKQMLQREGLSVKNNAAINYAIQKLYKQDNIYYDPITKKQQTLAKLEYDFNDPMGNNDWRNMFVIKLLDKGKGQCHSLPLNYLCVTEQLGGKAYLALSPSHSYIQYFDEKGRHYNFETTNGHFISEAWLMQSTGVSAAALKQGTYLDSLSGRRLYAHCLGDMLYGYVTKIGYDGVADQMVKKILETDSSNISALSIQAWYLREVLNEKAYMAGSPPPEQLINYPALYAIYKDLMTVYAKLDQIGVQSMPPDVYRQWLKSMDEDNQKEQDRQEYEKLLRQIQKLKKIKPTFTNTPEK